MDISRGWTTVASATRAEFVSLPLWARTKQRKEALNELQAWANTVRNPATPFRCEEIADGIEAVMARLR